METKEHIFVGPEAEGPARGTPTVFIPATIPGEIVRRAISQYEDKYHRWYFGAGGYREIPDSHIECMKYLLDRNVGHIVVAEISDPYRARVIEEAIGENPRLRLVYTVFVPNPARIDVVKLQSLDREWRIDWCELTRYTVHHDDSLYEQDEVLEVSDE